MKKKVGAKTNPLEIVKRNREIDQNVEIILVYQLIERLIGIQKDNYFVEQATATDLFECIFMIRKLSEYIRKHKTKTNPEIIEVLEEYINDSNTYFDLLNEQTKNFNCDLSITRLQFPSELIDGIHKFYTDNIHALMRLLKPREISIIYTNTIIELKNSIRYAINEKKKNIVTTPA